MSTSANLPEVAGGSIDLVVGPARSGKRAELWRRMLRHMNARRRCVVLTHDANPDSVEYSLDPRRADDPRVWDSDEEMADNPTLVTVRTPTMPASTLAEADHHVCKGFDVVGIDKGHLFDDVALYCERWANVGKVVIVAALDGDYHRRPFDGVLQLLPLAEGVVKLSAVCECSATAAFSMRFVAADGGVKYRAVCRRCHRDAALDAENVPPGPPEEKTPTPRSAPQPSARALPATPHAPATPAIAAGPSRPTSSPPAHPRDTMPHAELRRRALAESFERMRISPPSASTPVRHMR